MKRRTTGNLDLRTVLGREQGHVPDSRSGLISGRFLSELFGVNLKSNPASLLVYQYTVDEWPRRPEGCSRPRNSGRGVKSSGGPMHPTSDECLDWITSPTRSRERRKEKPSS